MIHQKASESARQLLKKLKVVKPPVDIRKIIKELGILISEASHEDDGMSGLILKGKGGRVLIGVNASHCENRKRFTLAHELGHYKLHTKGVFVDPEVNFFIKYRSKDKIVNKTESEANSFAAELLMPKEWIMDDYETLFTNFKQLDINSMINILATKYEVSFDAMRIRFNDLSLVK